MSNTCVGRNVWQFPIPKYKSVFLILAFTTISLFHWSAAKGDALWVAESGGTMKINGIDGSILFELLEDPYGTGAVGIDHTNGEVWTWGEQRLRAFDPTGTNLLDIESGNYPIWEGPNDLIVDGDSDRLWVNLGNDLYLLDMTGQVLGSLVNYGYPCNSMTLDRQRSWLWLCAYESVKAYDSSFQEVANIPLQPSDVVCRSAWDPFLDEIWVAVNDKLRRYDVNGQLTFEISNPAGSQNTLFLKPDGSGGVWIGTHTDFQHMDSAGTFGGWITPFTDFSTWDARDAVTDPVDGSIWIANDTHLRRFSTAGVQLQETYLTVNGSERYVQNMELFLDSNGPTVANDAGVTDEDTAVVLDVLANDFDQVGSIDPTTVTVTVDPQYGTATVDTLLGTVSYVPAPDFFGPDGFEYTVRDDQGNESGPAMVTIDVLPVNDAPVANNDVAVLTEDTTESIYVLANDSDVDNALTIADVVVISAPENGVVSADSTENSLVYTPSPNFSGTDQLQYQITDANGASSAAATVSLTVNPLNDQPEASGQSVVTPEDTALSITLAGNDMDGDPLTFAVATQPGNGTLSGVAPNITYTPSPNFNGNDSFDFIVNDGTVDSAAATIDIEVAAINDIPVAAGQSLVTSEDTTLDIVLSGSDAEEDTLTFVVQTNPSNGVLSGSAPNLTFTPSIDFNGTDSFGFVVSDGFGDSPEAVVSLTVTPINDAPSAISGTAVTDEDIPVAVTLTGADPDGDTISFSVDMLPANGTLSGIAPELTYTPNPDFNGSDSFTFSTSDGILSSATATYTLTVNAVNNAPTISSTPPTSATPGGTYSYQVVATDADGDALSYALATAPVGMTISAGGLVEWTPTAGGSANVTIEVSDGRAGTVQQSFAIDVVSNLAPEFTQLPLLNAPLGALYQSVGQATDPEGDAVTIVLAAGPAGAQLQDLGGGLFELTWPSAGSVGDSIVFEIVATDTSGASTTLNLNVQVTGSTIANSHLGTDFWASFGFNFNNTGFGLGAMPLSDPGRKLQLVVGAPTGATGVVEIASEGFVQSFTVAAGDAVTIDLPTNIMGRLFGNGSNSTPRTDAVHVTSDNAITVAGINWAFATTDAFLVLPVTTLGTSYLVTGYENVLWGHDEIMFSALAVEENTTVTITPVAGVPLYAGDQFRTPTTVTLNRGEAWSPQFKYIHAVSIDADKPVAAFAGSSCANVPVNVGTCDHLWQQFLPDTSLASRYLVAPIATRTASLYRVLASEDDTRLYINDQYVALLNRGDKFERVLPGALEVVASRPVVAVQYTLGNAFDKDVRLNDLADPFMLNLAPADAFLADYTFVVPSGDDVLRDQPNNIVRPPIEEHHLSIVIPALAASSLVLDGVSVDTSTFTAVGSSEFLAGAISITPGTHRMAANDPFGLHVYGFGPEESYGYYAGLIFPDGTTNLSLTVAGPTAPLVIGSEEACLSIEIRDLGGALIPRARYQVNITGTQERLFTGFSNSTGQTQYCYTQPIAGIDSAIVSVAGDSQLISIEWLADTDPGTNGAPAFLSLPNLVLYDQTFVYPVATADPDGDAVTLTIANGPAGMMYSSVTGQVTWTPVIPADRIPTLHTVELVATDPTGATATQLFEITVYYPPQMSQFPSISFVDAFGGRRESSIRHIGGDIKLMQGRVTSGSPGARISRLDIYDQWTVILSPLSFDFLEGIGDPNPMCRVPGAFIGSFDTAERFFDPSMRIPASSVGPVVDTNGDGTVDNADDIYSFHAERSSTVRLYNLTTRQTVWSNTETAVRHGHQPAIVNLDSDPDMEFVVATNVLIAFDTDGTELWRSAIPLSSFGRARAIPIVASDIDGDGSTELIYGPHVFNAAGQELWRSDVAAIGRPNLALPVPADLDGDGEQEVLFGNQVRDTDGTLLWTIDATTGETAPHAYHAVADIVGDARLEVVSSVYTASGPRMFAWDADGNVLWQVATQGVAISYTGVPSIADFDGDGELDIFQPNAKTLISIDGRIKRDFNTSSGTVAELKILDLNGDGVYETFDGRQEFEHYLSSFLWDTPSTGHPISFGDQNPFKFVDSDHDGYVELFIATSNGLGLYESQDGSWQLPVRDYRQHLYYDQDGFGVDAYAPANPVGLQADAWLGNLFVNGSLAGGFSFAVDVSNRGTANIVEDVTVSFYRGVPDTGTFLGDVVIPDGLTAGEIRSVSIPLAHADFDGMMSATLSFSGPLDQCEVQNDTVAGTFTELEIFDGPTEYRTDRYSFIYRISQRRRDIGWLTTPPTSVTLGQTLVYDADAVVANFGDSVRYRLVGPSRFVRPPDGVAIDTVTGVVTWTPTFEQVGTHVFSVNAQTLVDADNQTLTIEVLPRVNEVPVITTTPMTGLLLLGSTFTYDADATDADNDTLLYELIVAPPSMTIDSATGFVSWVPDATQIGLHPVTVAVDDSFGGVVTQSFSLQVGSSTNTGPTITSTPPFTAKATFEYQYQLTVDDPDGDFIAYSVQASPAGMIIDGNGLLSWTPAVVGVENIVVRASDGQAFADQGWTITVSDAAIPLEATISATPSVVDLNATVDLTVGFSGAAGPVNIAVTVDGNPVVVNANGVATVLADTVGLHTATAIVTDPYASDSATVNYTVVDPTSTSSPPIVGLTSPGFEEEVTAPRDAIGSVSDPDNDLLSWFLAIQARGAAPTEFTTIASGTTAVPNDVLGQIDPTMLLNGLYSVILQATDAAGNVSQDVRVIRVTGDLKIGNFSITFEDFSAPVAGLPVTVLRTYDSRRRNENLDFGFGWSVDYQNVRLQESRDIGFSWTLIEEDLGLFSQWCVRPNGDPTVTVRMPDGEVESFVARAEPECTQIVPTVDVQIVFDPIDGTDSTLEQTDFGVVRIVGNNIVDLGAPGVPIDPDAYRLTTPEGLVFTLDQSFGIQQVEEPNGSTLTFSNSGIVHSQGFALTFVRDGVGRITAITAPDGSQLTYAYDANGDLTGFTDQVTQTTNYTYQVGTEHYLEDILDPRGIRVSRNEYDAEGRLIAIIDADGNRIEYTHDISGRVETIRDRRGNPTVYVYDDDGNVLSETNALLETITRTYDADRNELSMTNDLGQTTSWSYDARGNQLSETNALVETTTSSYDTRNLLLTVVDPLGIPVMSNVYEPNNTNLLTLTDALGGTTSFHWDAGIGSGCSTGASRGTTDALLSRTTIQPQCIGPFAELPAWQEDARGVRTSFGYDSLGRQVSETTTRTDESGIVQSLVTTMEYDDKGRLFRVTDPELNVTVTEYNAIDKESATIDANLARTEFYYDARGNLVQTRFPDLTSEITGYDENGNVVSQSDRLGRTTTMTYDAANRLIETIFPDGTPGDDLDNPRTTNEYDSAGRLTATVDERGNRTVFEYDNAGRRTLVRDALLQETRFEYDARGLRTAMIDALGRRTEFVYDNAGRLTETIFPDDTAADQTDNLRSSTGYDALGRKTSETDLAGLTTTFEYDVIGNLTAVVDALTQRTEYSYDEQSNKVSQTDAAFRTTNWAYDDLGRVVSRTLPAGQSESFSYDANGNRTGHTDFNGAAHSFAYDDLNRQTTATYADGVIVTSTYTVTGQVETVTDNRGTTSFSYDERERLLGITYPNAKSITYSYDASGNRTGLTTANQTLIYTFDVLNRLETVTDEVGTTTYGYDAVGNRASINNANGTRTGYIHDPLNRLTRLDQLDSLAVLFDQHSYTLGANGNRTQHAELNGRVVDYVYDDLYRLTSETVTDATLGNRTTSWVYDAVGNRLSENDSDVTGITTTTYVYDLNDRLSSETATGAVPGVTTYAYDANGNTLTKSDGTTYAYDSRNRLANLNAGQVTYQYDALGIRQSETAASLTTQYLTDPNRDYAQVIEESFDLNSFAEVKYSYGDDLIHQHRRVDATTTNSSTYHYDGIGSTRQLTDASGSVTDTYAYTAFGETEGATGFTQNDYLYTGEQFDPNLGFYYLRARYYNPRIGRFATMDTFQGFLSDPLSLHKYLYAQADSVDRIDPSGNVSLLGQLKAIGIHAMQTLRSTATSVHTIRRINAKLCAIGCKLALPYVQLRALLGKGSIFQSHHVLQNAAAARIVPNYRRLTAIAVPLLGGTGLRGGAHRATWLYQMANPLTGAATLNQLKAQGFRALRAAGCRARDATKIVNFAGAAAELMAIGVL